MNPSPSARLQRIRKALAAWYRENRRDLPWRRTRDPYRIWISEIMLQQTRVAAVIPYYERFLERFPTIDALAKASDPELLSAWAGLGYYSRARNLRSAAQKVLERKNFPNTYPEILTLPGVGPYTAAAVASICFGEPTAVLDGNVMRVLSRLNADAGDITNAATRQRLQAVAQDLLDVRDPAQHNQAVMELGALVCTPRDPLCGSCPVREYCEARSTGLERELPIKKPKADVRHVKRQLLVAIRNGHILLWQRSQDATQLKGFWELPEPNQLPAAKVGAVVHRFRHAITNHRYEFEVAASRVHRPSLPMQWVPLAELAALPLSTVARKALRPFLKAD